MRFGSVCSGIEAASVAWHPLGMRPAFFSEIDRFPCAALNHHWPDVPNLGDMTKFKEWPDAAIDVLVGGTPCQSFSVAGLRKGLDDPRGNLMLTYLAIAAKYRPTWLVWENVPGVLSVDGGRAFGALLGGLAKLGYGFAYRVLDAQFFGVPQRRRRVFVVGYLGDWRRAAAVLFERHSLSGNPAPRREAGQRVAGTFKACAGSGGWSNSADHAAGGYMQPVASPLPGHHPRADLDNDTYVPTIARTIATREGTSQDWETTTMVAEVVGSLSCNTGPNGHDAGNFASNQGVDAGYVVPIPFSNRGIHSEVPETLRAGSHGALPMTLAIRGRGDGHNLEYRQDGTAKQTYLHQAMQVRRLTPRECERLQGFPDDYTLIPYRGKPAADGPRYKALGNSMAVPVMAWIGRRIQVTALRSVTPEDGRDER